MTRLAATVCSLLLAGSAAALPDAARQAAGTAATQWREIGAGELRWLGLRIYRATLWSTAPGWSDDVPFALVIRYERAIAAEDLVDVTLEEIERLGGWERRQLEGWKDRLAQIFPDVEPGDELIGVSLPGRGAWFFHGGRPIGTVSDERFARAFFGIWLDPRTRKPGLRERLLGG